MPDWHGARRPALRTLDLSTDPDRGPVIGRRGWRALLLALSGLRLEFLGLRGQRVVGAIPPPGTAEELDVSSCGLGGKLVVSPGVRRLTATGNPSLQAVAPLPESLEALDVTRCLCLAALPPVLPQGLRELRLCFFQRAALPPLPPGLEVLDLSRCPRMLDLPLPLLPASLRELRLCDMAHLCGAVAQLPPLPRLEVLDLSYSLSEALPEALFEGFPMLRELDMTGARALRNLAGLYLPSLRKLAFGGFNAEDAGLLPERLHEFTALTELEYTGDDCPQALPPGLQSLKLRRCAALRSMVQLPPRLKSLFLHDCGSLQSLPQLPAGLTELEVMDAPSLVIGELPRGLQVLRLVQCPCPAGLPAGLQVLDLSANRGVRVTARLDRLEELVLCDCELTALPSAALFPKLRVLDVSGNPELRLSADNWPDRLRRLVVDGEVEVPASCAVLGTTEVVRTGW